ncbi:MAG TPA: terminase family protein [Roseiflexaceae bacterium]|nr:terminase family protein [Roseiflexaceae bacterium]
MAESEQRAAVEFAKCNLDPAYFTDQYLIIDDAQGHGEGGGVMPFKLWPAQVGVMWLLLTRRLVIILKARQLGISWVCCGYALWHCVFQPGKRVLLFSKNENDAKENLERVKKLFERLPEWMLEMLPVLVTDNSEELVWSNGSKIESLPSSPDSGRGRTGSLVILDEAAFQLWADRLYAALKPTIDGGGQLIVLSSANGVGNLFHLLWTRAVAGLNAYAAVFLPWWTRPGRDEAWYARQFEEYPDPAIVRQEYPATANEAFLVSGRTRFSPDWISAQGAHVRSGIPRDQWPEALRKLNLAGGSLTIYRLPDPEREYSLGADVAEGLEHGDYSVGEVLDSKSWEQCAELHGHWEPDTFAALLDALATAYGCDPLIERNNHGHAVLLAFKHLNGRPMLGHDQRPGWLTNEQYKKIAIDFLAAALRDGSIIIHTLATLNELQIYSVLKNGSTGAPNGYFDDRVMALAIALQAALRGNRKFLR